MFFVLFCASAGAGSGEMAIESIYTSFKNKGTISDGPLSSVEAKPTKCSKRGRRQ